MPARSQRLDTRLTIRLPSSEYNILKSRASDVGLSLAGYCRLLITADAQLREFSDTEEALIDAPCFYLVKGSEIKGLTTQIARLGQQYNQSVFALNKLLKQPYAKTQKILDVATAALLNVNDIYEKMDGVEETASKLRRNLKNGRLLFVEGGD